MIQPNTTTMMTFNINSSTSAEDAIYSTRISSIRHNKNIINCM